MDIKLEITLRQKAELIERRILSIVIGGGLGIVMVILCLEFLRLMKA